MHNTGSWGHALPSPVPWAGKPPQPGPSSALRRAARPCMQLVPSALGGRAGRPHLKHPHFPPPQTPPEPSHLLLTAPLRNPAPLPQSPSQAFSWHPNNDPTNGHSPSPGAPGSSMGGFILSLLLCTACASNSAPSPSPPAAATRTLQCQACCKEDLGTDACTKPGNGEVKPLQGHLQALSSRGIGNRCGG